MAITVSRNHRKHRPQEGREVGHALLTHVHDWIHVSDSTTIYCCVEFAAARYAKALSHCAKFVDLGPDDLKEVNEMKLTLNLNLSLAYLKLENPDQALRYANDALALDENHTKALYRRASVYYEKKNWEAATKDLKKAFQDAPEDKAIQKLQEKVDAQIKRQKLKEKKMAQKMFS